MPRRVLFIALAFPPQNSSGTFRSVKFVKYLGEFGWEPVVVTLDWARVLAPQERDETLLEDLPPDLPIYRLAPFNPVQALGERVRRRLSFTSPLATGTDPVTLSEVPSEDAPRARWYRLLRALYHFGLAPIGDEHFYWAMRALPTCVRIARRHQVEAIFVSASPWTSAMLGVWLKRWLHRPLIVDFRDYWTQWPIKARRPVRDRLDAWAERWILRAADRLVCVHEAMVEDFARLVPETIARSVVIPNGYDAEDFRTLVRVSPEAGAPTTLVHTGMVWGDAATAFLEAIAWLKEQPLTPSSWRVHFVGGLPPSNLRFVRERGLHDVVAIEPRTTHREALARMVAADVLLLLITSHEGGRKWFPGKLFEYMAAGRPILAVVPSGLASALIAEAGVGVSVEPREGERLRTLLRHATLDPEGFARQFYHPQPAVIRRYERRALTRRLAEILEDVVDRARAKARSSQ
ncbi:MAG: glycosyltransferase family 4 protein [Blastocatellia bacterium]|nr:glycosyltransferase family 4 protein [Blastocatellia bacterium]